MTDIELNKAAAAAMGAKVIESEGKILLGGSVPPVKFSPATDIADAIRFADWAVEAGKISEWFASGRDVWLKTRTGLNNPVEKHVTPVRRARVLTSIILESIGVTQ